MALYEKKLHIRKNGVVTDINLWTESGEAGTPALHIRDGVNLVHARLGEVTDGLASDLRVRKDNVVYAVLKNRWITINIVQSANQTITVNVDGAPHTESFAVPYGTAYTAIITAAAGFAPGTLSSSGGTAEGDVTISATPATQNLVAGSYTTVSGNNFRFTIPQGVTVLNLQPTNIPPRYKWVGVTPGHVLGIFLDVGCDYEGSPLTYDLCVQNISNGKSLRIMVISPVSGNIADNIFFPVVVRYGPEINAHGPTDGSVA